MSVPLRTRMQRAVKRVFINRGIGRLLPRRIGGYLHMLVYVAGYSRWLREHDCRARFSSRMDLFAGILEEEGLDDAIDYLEFGVYMGRSMRWWVGHVRHPEARFYGFDTFEGLPEDWGATARGELHAGGKVPEINDDRCSFRVGLFQQTLGQFMDEVPLDRRKVINLDADLYSSTLYVLSSLAPRLRSGDIVIFDELGGLRTSLHEFRAAEDFFSAFPVRFKVLGATELYRQVAVKIE